MLIFLLIISSSLVSPDPNSRGLETVQEKNNDNNPKIEVNGKKEINIQKENVRYFKSPKGIIAINANAFAENAKSGSKFTIQKAETDCQVEVADVVKEQEEKFCAAGVDVRLG